jgi:bifunctional lysine-specific demethylase and histidyl-hydroxylase NO66
MFKKGYTCVINKVEQRWEPVLRLSEAFEQELGHRAGVNLYLSPAGNQGFEAHMDWMDAFVLQVCDVDEGSSLQYRPSADRM